MGSVTPYGAVLDATHGLVGSIRHRRPTAASPDLIDEGTPYCTTTCPTMPIPAWRRQT